MIDIMHHPIDASTYDLLCNDKFIRDHFTVITSEDLEALEEEETE